MLIELTAGNVNGATTTSDTQRGNRTGKQETQKKGDRKEYNKGHDTDSSLVKLDYTIPCPFYLSLDHKSLIIIMHNIRLLILE